MHRKNGIDGGFSRINTLVFIKQYGQDFVRNGGII